MSRPNRNESIERKVAIILAIPDPPKKLKHTAQQIFASKAISVLNKFDDKINAAIKVLA